MLGLSLNELRPEAVVVHASGMQVIRCDRSLHTSAAQATYDMHISPEPVARHPVVELIQEICSRLEYLALTALPTDPRAQEAFTEVRDQFSGLWNSG